MQWESKRPHILVVTCSDGRLQEATDQFLSRELHIVHYDRLYVPGGIGALSASGRDFMRAHQLQQECRLLVDMHRIQTIIGLFHGPASDGPDEAMCADYRRKQPWASADRIRAQQEKDATELLTDRWQWADRARILIYRCEMGANGALAFASLHTDGSR